MRTRWEYLPYASVKSVSAPDITVQSVSYFRGDDFGHAPMSGDMSRASDSLNMLRDEPGQVRKRMGWHTIRQYDGRINGAYIFGGEVLIHAGTALYAGEEKIGELADEFSSAQVLGDALWILDGQRLWRVGKNNTGYTLEPAENSAYIPMVIISRNPEGGGTVYEEYNLLSRGFKNSFYGKEGVTIYHLTDNELDDDEITAEILDDAGIWNKKSEGTDFSVDRKTGTVTFETAPGVSPVTGEDNVKITAYKTREGYAERINACTLSVLYGVGGVPDRLFVGGNPDYPGIDWHSEQSNAAMFGDLSYSVLSGGEGVITGYSIVADRLASHRAAGSDGRSIILRRGILSDEGQAQFPISGALQGEAAIAPRTCTELSGEPLFLTRSGVYAITASDITGEKRGQCRSDFLNTRLLRETGLKNACACVYGGYYLLCLNGHVYALDSLQRAQSANEPYSAYQYESYYLDNIPARVMWQSGGTLFFGTKDGRVAAFYSDKNALTAYNDDGEAIHAYWETPYFAGQTRHTRKDFNYLSVTLVPHSATSLAVSAVMNGVYKKLFCDETGARYFDFNKTDFARLSFSVDRSPKNIRKRISVRVADKIALRLENNAANEPFGIYDMTLEYTETGKI